MSNDWETLDTKKVLEKRKRQQQETTSGSVGAFAVPLGAEPMRPPMVVKPKKKKSKK
jgi:hypothetical protein